MTENQQQQQTQIAANPDSIESAQTAGLRYVSDTAPGIGRKRAGKNFYYVGVDGQRIRDEETLRRIKSLAIPPAWTEVWICPFPNGHLQATGRDQRGRKQNRYHPRWRQVRDEAKYERMMRFGAALPKIRERVEQDLRRHGLPREKVLATVVRLLETTFIRIGNAEYARTNESYGLTTMQDEHADITGSTIHFHFRGKSGVQHTIDVKDKRLAKIVKQCQDLPGQELLQYLDEQGAVRDIGSADVNAYLHEITGEHFTAKDFRTWAGTVLAALMLQECEASETNSQLKKNVVRTIESVAERLGNTPSVCRKCYVHPAIVESYMDGSMLDALKQRVEQEIEQSKHALRPEEQAVISLLEQRLEREAA